VITTRKVGWFVKDNDVAVIINAQVKTGPQANPPLTFPLTANVKFGDASAGQVSLPIEYSIVSGLKLTQGTVTYTGIGVEVTLVNAKDTTKLGFSLFQRLRVPRNFQSRPTLTQPVQAMC
jgi:hypothetical protein